MTYRQEAPRKERKKVLKTADDLRDVLSKLSANELRSLAKKMGIEDKCGFPKETQKESDNA